MSPDGELIAFVSNRDGNNHIWLVAKDGTNQRPFTRSPQAKESAPHFLRDGTLAYLVEQKEGGRTTTQVVKADLTTGKVAPLAATDLLVTDFAVSGSVTCWVWWWRCRKTCSGCTSSRSARAAARP